MNADLLRVLLCTCVLVIAGCRENTSKPSSETIAELNLKRGQLIVCGPAEQQLGSVYFAVTGDSKLKEEFNLGMKLLHSFEYGEAEKVFSRIIDREPNTAMAYWGIAMSNFHPLWTPPSADELNKGRKAIDIAKSIKTKSEKEAAYIKAVASFYEDYEKLDHRTRTQMFEKSMKGVYESYPEDKEAAALYALALNAAADPADKTFKKQKEAGVILQNLYPGQPNHPGIVHYIIHTYDSPELAHLALPAARKYASVAPSSAHALHMPSHIFTRLGLWEENIESNKASVESAKCYAEAAGIKGHWDEELHGLDYLMYAYLQKGDSDSAKLLLDYLNSIKLVQPLNFKVSYAFAAIPSRYYLENKMWKEAAIIETGYANFPWNEHPWQKAIVHFTRLMGNIHLEKIDEANTELQNMKSLHKKLVELKDDYKANQVLVEIKTGEAWLKLHQRNKDEAIALMKEAVAMEDKTEKHPVTPGEVLPARELLADMYMELGLYQQALAEYETDLKKHPNRLNGLFGAANASQKLGNAAEASKWFKHLLNGRNNEGSSRHELIEARKFLEEGSKTKLAFHIN